MQKYQLNSLDLSSNYLLNFEKRMLYGALEVTLWTCYGAL